MNTRIVKTNDIYYVSKTQNLNNGYDVFDIKIVITKYTIRNMVLNVSFFYLAT